MKVRRSGIVLAAVLLIGSATLRADSVPVIQGAVSAIELCPQEACGAAVFVGVFTGQVGINPDAFGLISVAARHEELPDEGETAEITGGLWNLQLLGRLIRGRINRGRLENVGNDLFRVIVEMEITRNGTGTMFFVGVLSHQNPIPTLRGRILQQLPSP